MSVFSRFTKEERTACLPIIDLIVRTANHTRQEGVLGLEDFAKKQDNDFYIFATMLVVDGIDPELVKGILETLISTENHTGAELLQRILITEGLLSVQAGENPRLIETKLLCCLGEDFLRQRGHYPIYNPQEELNTRIKEYCPTKPKCSSFAEFEWLVMSLSDADIQEILKEVTQYELALAIKGCSEKAARHLLENVSPRLAIMILDDVEYKHDTCETEIIKAQKKFTEIYRIRCV